MDFGDERYVRVYTRDTATWKLLSEEAKCLLPILLRKADRAGVVEFGGAAMVDAVVALTDLKRLRHIIEEGLPDLASRAVIEIHEHWLVFPNFMEAQESPTNDKRRKAESRAKRRDIARRVEHEATVTKRDRSSQNVTDEGSTGEGGSPETPVTKRDRSSQNVTDTRLGSEGPEDQNVPNRDRSSQNRTDGHKTTENVHPNLTEPNRTEPIRAQPPYPPEGDGLVLHLDRKHPDEEMTSTEDLDVATYRPSGFVTDLAKRDSLTEGEIADALRAMRGSSRNQVQSQRRFDSRFKRYLAEVAKAKAANGGGRGARSNPKTGGWDGPMTKKLFGGDPRKRALS